MNEETPVANLIKARRTVRLFKDDVVPEALLLELLNVAVWAPNHEHRQPWRFILFQGGARSIFAEAMVRTYSSEDREKYGPKKRAYLEAVPAHLIVLLKKFSAGRLGAGLGRRMENEPLQLRSGIPRNGGRAAGRENRRRLAHRLSGHCPASPPPHTGRGAADRFRLTAAVPRERDGIIFGGSLS
ncbi:MAG: nitroreductase [Paenibacillus sp.]|nr:nitroreductase [Paenibacillus sp.]